MPNKYDLSHMPDHVLRAHLAGARKNCEKRERELRQTIREAQRELEQIEERKRDIAASLQHLEHH
ncbi:hypothetical protein ACFTSD_02520 [Nocardiaceae bacterium NPDC056970]